MTYNLSNEEAEVFNLAIENIPDDIPYVVLRNYDYLPDSIPGADIDIFSPHPNDKRLQETFFELGFKKGGPDGSFSGPLIKIIKKGIINPISALKFAVNYPVQLIFILISSTNNYQLLSGSEGFEMNRIHYNTLKIDIYNHLAHESPSSGKFHRLEPEIEFQMIANRQLCQNFFTPHPIDEFVHMICRGTFDHHGEFRDYYISRCNDLQTKFDDKSRLQKLLGLVFFDAAEVVMECIEEGEYDQIKQKVRSYSNY